MRASKPRSGCLVGEANFFYGTVVNWNTERGFGFIKPLFGADTIGDIYTHATQIVGPPGRKNLRRGQEVEFQLETSYGKLYATHVRVVENEPQPVQHENMVEEARR